MTRIYRSYSHTYQFQDTCLGCCKVIGKRIKSWFVRVFKQVTTEETVIGCQDSDGSFGMPWNGDDSSLNTVFREVVPIFDKKIRRESFRPSKSGEDRNQHPDEEVRFISVHEHISVFDHAQIVVVHGDLAAKPIAEIGSIPGMIEVSMGQNDELEKARLAASVLKFFHKFLAVVGTSCVDQDIARIGPDEIAIHTSHPKREWHADRLNIVPHFLNIWF